MTMTVEDIDSLADRSFLAILPLPADVSPRTAAYAAVRWARVKHPNDTPSLHAASARRAVLGER